MLERKGARVGLITTEGFRDVLEIGRQMRHQMYDLALSRRRRRSSRPAARRDEVRGAHRLATGQVLVPLDEARLPPRPTSCRGRGVEAIAVVPLFSFLDPAHERASREIIAERHPACRSRSPREVDPAFREYERTCVTTFDAYVKPVVADYLADLERGLGAAGVPAPLQVMQSRGGIASAPSRAQRPVRLFLSGPAAGVIGGLMVGPAAGVRDLITIDIGGTSCDIALIDDGRPLIGRRARSTAHRCACRWWM